MKLVIFMGGHLEIQRANHREMRISEREQPFSKSDDCTLRQVLECDADAFACHTTSWVHTHDKMAKAMRDVVSECEWMSDDIALLQYFQVRLNCYR